MSCLCSTHLDQTAMKQLYPYPKGGASLAPEHNAAHIHLAALDKSDKDLQELLTAKILRSSHQLPLSELSPPAILLLAPACAELLGTGMRPPTKGCAQMV